MPSEEESKPKVEHLIFDVTVVDGTPTTVDIVAPNGLKSTRTARQNSVSTCIDSFVRWCTSAHVHGVKL